jgi:hypothetical protein
MNKAEKPEFEKIAEQCLTGSHTIEAWIEAITKALETAYLLGRKAQMEHDAERVESLPVDATPKEIAQAIRNQGV